jgi:hypothetical protein
MRARQPRRQVHVAARMRSGTSWTDICIKNMSGRGLMAETEVPPRRGSYVEIRRGQQIIVGRIIWAEGNQFGIRSQDRIDVDAILNEPRLANKPASATAAAATAERRRDPNRRRLEDIAARAEQSRRRSAAFQFLIVVGLGVLAATILATEVYKVLSVPLSTIGNRL